MENFNPTKTYFVGCKGKELFDNFNAFNLPTPVVHFLS